MKTVKKLYSEDSVASPHFLSPNRRQLYKAVEKRDKTITQPKIGRFLESQDAYTLNKAVNRNFKRNHYRVFYINELWQIDLADVSAFSKDNDGYKYLLTCIDVLTKYAWVVPLKNKSADVVTKAFREILQSGHGTPKVVSSDKGKEFNNSQMRSLLQHHNIKQQFLLTTSLFKASVVEIFNRTLKSRMFRYLTSKGINYRRYIDVLDDIVKAYNSTVHSTTRMKPRDVKPHHVPYIYHNTHRKHKNEGKTNIQHLQPGDYVRVARKRSTFQQTFSEKWTREVFCVAKVIHKLPYWMYELKDMNNVKLTGKFYDRELQKITLPSNYIVRVLKTSGLGKTLKKYVLFANGHKEWINNNKK